MAVSDKTLNTLIEAVRRVSNSLDLGEVLDTILDSLKELVNYSAAVVCVVDAKTGAVHGLRERGYPAAAVGENFLEAGSGIIGWVIEHKKSQIVGDVKHDTRYVSARAETVSEMAAPVIRYDGEVIGVINVEADWPDGYKDRDLNLLNMFAALAASAIDHTLLYRKVMRQQNVESELHLARSVVDSLLPRAFPLVEGFDIYGLTIPVREVGGDYFDFINSVTDRLGLVVADVSGKGLAAALIMVAFRAYIHATVINDFAMRIVMARVNRLVYESTEGDRFITTFYGLIDPEQKRLLYISAGHNPPLLLHEDGSSELLKDSGLPLGVFPDSRYSESVVNLISGEILVLYTDGVIEARNAADQDFGVEKLEETVRRYADQRAHEICNKVVEAVNEYSSEIGGPEDDLTISVIKIK
ncbi:MAG TPA: GAF domain-containing SpoIIE family protein phosphatase [Blastocatellia bacterium]|nr:GAF domain-containing SpoIIE family protein phosphatase [Blastocatellia bacterium]